MADEQQAGSPMSADRAVAAKAVGETVRKELPHNWMGMRQRHASDQAVDILTAHEWRTVVADPPWQPDLGKSWQSRYIDKAGPQRFYNTLTVEEIIALRPRLADQAHLYLWCVAQHVDWAYHVARNWQAEPIILLTWVKPGLGVGRFRCNTEHVLVARKGRREGNPFGQGGRHAQATDGTCFSWPRGRHSEKPQEFFDLVEKLSPGPYLEMYARTTRPKWSAWGNEI